MPPTVSLSSPPLPNAQPLSTVVQPPVLSIIPSLSSVVPSVSLGSQSQTAVNPGNAWTVGRYHTWRSVGGTSRAVTFQPLPGQAWPRFREITAMPTWLYCFLGYLAVLTSDQQTRDQLTYARLLVRESMRHNHLSQIGWRAERVKDV